MVLKQRGVCFDSRRKDDLRMISPASKYVMTEEQSIGFSPSTSSLSKKGNDPPKLCLPFNALSSGEAAAGRPETNL